MPTSSPTLADALALLRDLEWSAPLPDRDGVWSPCCPDCEDPQEFRLHAHGCRLALAIDAERYPKPDA